MDRPFRQLIQESSRLHHLGQPKAARDLEQEALEVGTEQDVNTLGYCYLFQQNDLERATALFRKNAEDYPASWNAHDSLAEALALQGEIGESLDCYRIAFEMAPSGHRARIRRTMDRLSALN